MFCCFDFAIASDCMFLGVGACRARLNFIKSPGSPPNHTASFPDTGQQEFLAPPNKQSSCLCHTSASTSLGRPDDHVLSRRHAGINSSKGFTPAQPSRPQGKHFLSRRARNKLVHIMYGNMLSLSWEDNNLRARVTLSLNSLIPEPTSTTSSLNLNPPDVVLTRTQIHTARKYSREVMTSHSTSLFTVSNHDPRITAPSPGSAHTAKPPLPNGTTN